ncbi:MAG TPA: hypothetical protein VMU69_30905 [Bradyrhizobium sp.]|nr:hypothetical protein [Bradyrhizobium sp.]
MKKFFDTNSLCLGAGSRNRLFGPTRGWDDSALRPVVRSANTPSAVDHAREALSRDATKSLPQRHRSFFKRKPVLDMDSGMDAGSREESASNQKSEARF